MRSFHAPDRTCGKQMSRITIDTDIGLLARGSAKITLPIYTFGKMRHAQRAARSGVMAGELGIDYTREEIAFLVRQAYYGARMTKKFFKDHRGCAEKIRQCKGGH